MVGEGMNSGRNGEPMGRGGFFPWEGLNQETIKDH